MTQPERSYSEDTAGRLLISWYRTVEGRYHWTAFLVNANAPELGSGTEDTLAGALEAAALAVHQNVGPTLEY